MINKLIVLLFTVILVTSCTTNKVAVDYDRNVDFSAIKTYQLEPIQSTNLSDLDKAKIDNALVTNFKFRGVLSTTDNPDVIIKIVPQEYVSSKTNSSVGFGMGTGGRVFGTGVSVGIPIRSKKLNQKYTVSMYQNNSLIWEGILNLEMPLNASAEAKQEYINRGVEKLLKNYPPKAK